MSQKDLDEAVGTEQSAGAWVRAARAAASAAQASISAVQASVSGARGRIGEDPAQLRVSRKSCRPSTASRASPKRRSAILSARIRGADNRSNVNPIKVYVPMSEQEYRGTGRTVGRGLSRYSR